MRPDSAQSQFALGAAPSTLAVTLCMALLTAGGGSSGDIAAGATMSKLAELGEKILPTRRPRQAAAYRGRRVTTRITRWHRP